MRYTSLLGRFQFNQKVKGLRDDVTQAIPYTHCRFIKKIEETLPRLIGSKPDNEPCNGINVKVFVHYAMQTVTHAGESFE
jgi:hypothetical protein